MVAVEHSSVCVIWECLSWPRQWGTFSADAHLSAWPAACFIAPIQLSPHNLLSENIKHAVLFELKFAGYSLRWIPKRVGLVVIKRAAVWRAVYGPSAAERTLGTIREEKGISSRFRVSILLHYDQSC